MATPQKAKLAADFRKQAKAYRIASKAVANNPFIRDGEVNDTLAAIADELHAKAEQLTAMARALESQGGADDGTGS